MLKPSKCEIEALAADRLWAPRTPPKGMRTFYVFVFVCADTFFSSFFLVYWDIVPLPCLLCYPILQYHIFSSILTVQVVLTFEDLRVRDVARFKNVCSD